MMPKIYIHIGLHKTATTTLQRNVFTKIKNNNLLYNPFEIMPLIEDAMILQDFSELTNEARKIYKFLLEKNLEKIDKEAIFISNENLSQNLFKHNWPERLELLYYFFPKAEIIIFFRDELNWIRSSYLQALHSGYICTFNEFLSYEKLPNYLSKKSTFSSINFTKINTKKMLGAYQKKYGLNNVHIFNYEDFKSDPETVIANLYKVLSLQYKKTINLKRIYANKSYTQNSVDLVLTISNFLRKIHLHKFLEAADRQLVYRRNRALSTINNYDVETDFNKLFLNYLPAARLNELKKNPYYLLIWLINRVHIKFVNLNPVRFFLTRYCNQDTSWFEGDDLHTKLKNSLIDSQN